MLCAFFSHPGNKDRLPANLAKVQSFQVEQDSSTGKESTCNAGDLLRFLSREDPLEKGMATHPSILYSPWGQQRVGQD